MLLLTVVKPALMAVLEKYRDAEQSERDKKKKEQEASKPPPASTETSQAPLLLLQSGKCTGCCDCLRHFM